MNVQNIDNKPNNNEYLQIEKDINSADLKVKEAIAFDKIGETAEKMGCLSIDDKNRNLNKLKKKRFEILMPLLPGIGLLAVAAAVAVVAIALIVSFPVFEVVFLSAYLGCIAFVGSAFIGSVLTGIGVTDLCDKLMTQDKIIKLHDEIDTAKKYLKLNAEKIKKWVDLNKKDIQAKLESFEKGESQTVNVKQLKDRLKLCKDLDNVLLKKAV